MFRSDKNVFLHSRMWRTFVSILMYVHAVQMKYIPGNMYEYAVQMEVYPWVHVCICRKEGSRVAQI